MWPEPFSVDKFHDHLNTMLKVSMICLEYVRQSCHNKLLEHSASAL